MVKYESNSMPRNHHTINIHIENQRKLYLESKNHRCIYKLLYIIQSILLYLYTQIYRANILWGQ